MHDKLHEGGTDVPIGKIRQIYEAGNFLIDGFSGGFERFGQHRNIGVAFREISETMSSAAWQNRELSPRQLFDRRLLRIHQPKCDGRGAVDLDFGVRWTAKQQ
jgi:hypothetical protein